MKYPKDTLKRFIVELQEDGVNLSKWEEDFVENVREKLARYGSLSVRQVEILDRIYAERTP